MAPVDIEAFVEQWHEALAAKLKAAVDRRAVDRLTGEILASGGLRQLAETPLLCAAVCYLHRVKQGLLPRRLNALYRELCDLLIHRLDETRFEKEGQERLNLALRGLDLEDKRSLLARLAHFMVREQAATLDRERAATQIAAGLRGLRKLDPAQAPDVLDALQERSGVLRGASPTLVEFAHNGLRSYLAATVFREESAITDLIEKALATADPDLPVLAAAQGVKSYRDELVRQLIAHAGRSSDAERQRALRIMAARCGATGEVSDDVTEALKGVEAAVLPPLSVVEAGQLADLGERAPVDLSPQGRNRRTRLPPLRCAASA